MSTSILIGDDSGLIGNLRDVGTAGCREPTGTGDSPPCPYGWQPTTAIPGDPDSENAENADPKFFMFMRPRSVQKLVTSLGKDNIYVTVQPNIKAFSFQKNLNKWEIVGVLPMM